jgi:hypothetical protein
MDGGDMETAFVEGVRPMATKKVRAKKQYGKLIRVSDALADALGDATGLEKMTMAEFGDTYLLPVVKRRYREAVLKKAKSLGDSS